jgi:hypothetical protein
MRRIVSTLSAIVATCLLLGYSGCVLEEKVIEVVLTGETCAEFQESHETEEYTTPVTIDYASEVDDILAGEGLSRWDIASAKVMSATYQVTEFEHPHDWTISGYITAEHVGNGGPAKIIDYTDQSLLAAQPAPIPAALSLGGVSVVNEALQAYLDGDYPMLRFEVNNGSVAPEPSPSDRLVFKWEACIKIHVLYQEELEVPDPF